MGNVGVLVVHMQKGYYASLVHHTGDKDKGIANIRQLVTVAEKRGAPIIFSEFFGSGKTISTVYGMQQTHQYSATSFPNCFIGDHLLAYRFKRQGVKRLVLAGFNKYVCIAQTLEGVLDKRFVFVSSEDILFTNTKLQAKMAKDQNFRETVEEYNALLAKFYQKQWWDTGKMYRTVDDLIKEELREEGQCRI